MTQEELLKYKIQKLTDFRIVPDALVTYILDLISGNELVADIKTEVISDKQTQLTNLEATKTRLQSEVVDLNK